jgi:predicted ester cyclase
VGAINRHTWLDIIIAQGLNGGDTSVIDKHTTPDLVDHQSYGIGFPSGPAGIKALVVVLHAAFPDFHIVVQDIVTSGDKLWGRAVSTGTFSGHFLSLKGSGTPGVGNKIAINVMDEFRFEHLTEEQLAHGQRPRAVEHWGVIDNLVLLLEMQGFDPTKPPFINPKNLPVYPVGL